MHRQREPGAASYSRLRHVVRPEREIYCRKRWLEARTSVTKVLVVDDDPDLLLACSLVLESEGYEVDAARNGSEAIDKLAEDGIDVVLLDVMMPVLDGLSVCKMVKKDPRTKDLPVVLISASTALRERGRHCADAVLEKPFDIDYLVDTVGHFAPMG